MGEGNFNKIGNEKRSKGSEDGFSSRKKDKSERSRPEMRLIRRKNIEEIKSGEGILEYLENLVMTTTDEKAKKKAATYLQRVKDVLVDGKSLNVIDSEALRDKVREILELKETDPKNKKDNAIQSDQLFDALEISDKSFPDKAAAGQEAESAPAEELDVSSSGVEVVPPEEGEEIHPDAIKPEKEPESIKPEESPEDKERRVRERQDRLLQLKTEIDDARKEYAEMDYKKKKAWNRLKSFMPSLFKDQREEDQDVAWCRALYDNKLFEYKNLLLEDAKERNVSNQELGALIKIFAAEANLNLADVHNQVKIEQHEGKISGFIKERSMEIVQKYKKLPLYEKIAIGAAFGVAGIGVGYIGGAAVGMVASAAAIRRVFMGMVTGTTVALGLESRERKTWEDKIENGNGKVADLLEGMSDEEKYKNITEAIEVYIKDEDNKLQKIKNKNLRNMAVGIGVGTLVGSASHWMEMLKNSETASDIFSGIKGGFGKVAEYFQGSPKPTVEGTGAYYDTDAYNAEEFEGARNRLSERYGIGRSGAAVTEGFRDVGASGPGTTLEVQLGSSLEGTIIKHLKESGMSAKEAGDKASILAQQYAEENGLDEGPYSLVQPGTQIELSPDGSKIISITSDHELGYLSEEGTIKIPESGAETVTSEQSGLSHVDKFPEDSQGLSHVDKFPEDSQGLSHVDSFPEDEPLRATIEVPENGTGEYAMEPARIRGINVMESNITEINQQLTELDDKILKIASGQYEGLNIQTSPETTLDELRNQKQLLEQAKDNWLARIYQGYVGSVRRLVCGGAIENWEKIGKMPANDLLDRKGSVGYKFFARVMDSHSPKVVELQRHISPLKGENVDEWIKRIAKIMNKAGIRKI